MAGDVATDFPLFPLGIVALPHELVPLHIFEPRYRTMIGECLDNETEFVLRDRLSDDAVAEGDQRLGAPDVIRRDAAHASALLMLIEHQANIAGAHILAELALAQDRVLERIVR